jgi:hypothetical protein
MSQRTRNLLIILAGVALLGAIVGWIDRSGKRDALTAQMKLETPAPVAAAAPKAPPKIYRMQASLEDLRKFPLLDGMTRADDAARLSLPQGLETNGEWVKKEDVLEGYVHPNGKRFFVIMQPGDRAYSVFLE